jgi:hypothetical protein
MIDRWLRAMLILPVVLAGCSTYVSDYRYAPAMTTAQVRMQGGNSVPSLSAIISLGGVRRADSESGIPSSVEVRIRLENTGVEPATLDPAGLELIPASLEAFDPAITVPPGVITVPPGQSQTITAYFPFQRGKSYDTMNLDTLRVKLGAKIGAQTIPMSVVFTRVP